MCKEAAEKYLVSGRRTLEDFLRRHTEETKPIYPHLLRRFKIRYSARWKEQFMNTLEEPIASRVRDLDTCNHDLYCEEKVLQMLERLGEKHGGLLTSPEHADLLLALKLMSLSIDEQEMFARARRSGKHINKYLGRCRKPSVDSEIDYDKTHKIKELADAASKELYSDENLVISILGSKARMLWALDYEADPVKTLSALEKECEDAHPLYASIMERTHGHYKTRAALRELRGFRRSLLPVVKE